MIRFAVCNELYRDWPIGQAFAHAQACGYEGVEIAPHTLGSFESRLSRAKSEELRSTAADHGLEIIGLHWLLAGTEGLHWTSDDADVRQKTAVYFARLIDLCARFSGGFMVLGSPKQRNIPRDCSNEKAIDFAADVVDKLLPRLADAKIVLAIEPLGPEETNFLNTAAQVCEFCRRWDSPWVRLHLDVKAMSTETIPIPEIIKNHRSQLAHFHANDPNRRGPGMGKVDFVPILQSLVDANYDRWISVEVFDETPGIDALARESIRNLKRDYEQARKAIG